MVGSITGKYGVEGAIRTARGVNAIKNDDAIGKVLFLENFTGLDKSSLPHATVEGSTDKNQAASIRTYISGGMPEEKLNSIFERAKNGYNRTFRSNTFGTVVFATGILTGLPLHMQGMKGYSAAAFIAGFSGFCIMMFSNYALDKSRCAAKKELLAWRESTPNLGDPK